MDVLPVLIALEALRLYLAAAVGILSETLAVAHSVLLVIIARLFLPVLSTVLPEPIVPMLVLLATQRVMPVMRALAVQQLLRAALDFTPLAGRPIAFSVLSVSHAPVTPSVL
jgi:hypothetical protein